MSLVYSGFDRFFEDSCNELKNSSSKISETLWYSLFPPGKLFRSKLFLSICEDLKIECSESLFKYSLFLEYHHSYSLVHDDLPCMDDDDIRRGRPSVHKKYGQWQAVLAGDFLLNYSFKFLAECESLKGDKNLQKMAFRYTTIDGLIEGQVLDLLEESKSFEDILKVHRLKTARLITLATLGSYFFIKNESSSLYKDLYKLGDGLGILFQLKDDLNDLEDEALNIYNDFSKRASLELNKRKKDVLDILERRSFTKTHDFISKYLNS